MAKIYDWSAIREEFVRSDVSTTMLAQKYGVSLSTVKKRSASEGWMKARSAYREKSVAKLANQLSSKNARRQARIMDVGEKALLLVERKTDEALAAERVMSPANLKMLTGALRDLTEIYRHNLNLDDPRARIKQIEAQTEKIKTEGTTDSGTVQIIIAGADEYKE